MNAKMAIENGVLENVIDGVVAARTSYTRGDFHRRRLEGEALS